MRTCRTKTYSAEIRRGYVVPVRCPELSSDFLCDIRQDPNKVKHAYQGSARKSSTLWPSSQSFEAWMVAEKPRRQMQAALTRSAATQNPATARRSRKGENRCRQGRCGTASRRIPAPASARTGRGHKARHETRW